MAARSKSITWFDGSHDAVTHKLLDNVDGADSHQVRKVLDGKGMGKLHLPGACSFCFCSLSCHGVSFPAAIPCHCIYSIHKYSRA